MKKENKLTHENKALIEQAKAEIEQNKKVNKAIDEIDSAPLKKLFVDAFKPLNEEEQKAILLSFANTYDFYDKKQFEAVKKLSKAKTNHQVDLALKDIQMFRLVKENIRFYISLFNYTKMDKELKKHNIPSARDFNFRHLFDELKKYEDEYETNHKNAWFS